MGRSGVGWSLGVWIALAVLPVGGAGQEVREGSAAPVRSARGAGEATVLALPRISGGIVFDGMPDEAAWTALEPLPVVQHWPDFGAPMSRRTEIRVAYDDEYLWASGRFYEEPGEVAGNSLQRDRWDGDDSFDLIIDSFNDDQTALKFTTTPLGILLDGEVLNDAQWSAGVPALNNDWNTFWAAETTRTEEGWFAEVRIPLSSLGFKVSEGQTVMGLIAARYLAGRNEKHIFPAIPPDWDMADHKPSQARDVVLTGVEEQAPLWVTPYAVAGVDRTRDADAEILRSPEVDVSRDVGMDVKYGLASNLTLDLTVNTDFAQVESDALLVNLDRFGLFFPEKRQFFQERSSTFGFALGEDNRLFHSRTIGLSDEGRPLTIFGGARLTGRVGAWDLGALTMQVDGAEGGLDENAGVVRASRRVLGSGQVGGMLTSRVRTDGGTDLSMGVDARVPLGGEILTLQVAQTRNEGDATTLSALDRTSARLFWERRTLQGIGYDASLTYSGPGYDPALGFEARDDFTATQGRLAYVWQPEGGRFDRVRLQAVTRSFWRNEDGSLESWLGRLQFLTDLAGGHWFNLTGNLTREDVADGFELPGAVVESGTYWGANLFSLLDLNRARTLTGVVNLWTGQAFDGYRFSLRVEPQVNFSRHLSVSASYNLHRLWFPDRDQRVNADLAVVRVRAALNPRLSGEVFVQYSAATDALSTNVRARYRFGEGRDLYLVLDEARDLENRHGLDDVVLGRTDRRLLLKYSWAFQP